MTVPAIQAHRGSADLALGIRENTIEAFVRAQLLGANGVELDVRRSADGALVVHHDAVIRGVGPVHEVASGQLPESVALLPAVLEACDGLEVNIELKNLPGEPGFDPDDAMARQVADLVVAAGRVSTVVISSFWPGSLTAVREALIRAGHRSSARPLVRWCRRSGAGRRARLHGPPPPCLAGGCGTDGRGPPRRAGRSGLDGQRATAGGPPGDPRRRHRHHRRRDRCRGGPGWAVRPGPGRPGPTG